jgi:hypothetical protein
VSAISPSLRKEDNENIKTINPRKKGDMLSAWNEMPKKPVLVRVWPMALPPTSSSSYFCKYLWIRGMRYTSTALYFYGASRKSLHKPRANLRNVLFEINYSFNYYLQIHVYSFYLELA